MKYLKKIIYVCVLFLCACSNESDDIIQTSQVSILEARQIARNYLTIEGNQYILDLTIEEAEKLGISKSNYTQLIQEVEDSNLFLQELMDKGEKIMMMDPQKIDIPSKRTVKTRSEDDRNELVRGILGVNNYQTKTTISAPQGAREIVFTGTTPCLISTISITCNGSTSSITSGPWGGNCSFPISYSPCTLEVTTYTLCSGGGSLGYVIYG